MLALGLGTDLPPHPATTNAIAMAGIVARRRALPPERKAVAIASGPYQPAERGLPGSSHTFHCGSAPSETVLRSAAGSLMSPGGEGSGCCGDRGDDRIVEITPAHDLVGQPWISRL